MNNKPRAEMNKEDYMKEINKLLYETLDMQLVDFVYTLLFKCKTGKHPL